VLSFYGLFSSNHQLQEAIAEADRLDPGWRQAELEAKRAVIPDAQNSGTHIINAKRLLPAQWPYWDFSGSKIAENQPKEEIAELQEMSKKLEPQGQLSARQTTALRAEIQRARAALTEIYKVADKAHGRCPILYGKDGISTLTPHTQEARELAELLAYDSMLRAQDKDLDGAVNACKCILHCGRAIGDEPTLISMLVRIALHRVALEKLARTLAQGEAKQSSLASLQRLLDEDAAEPLFLVGARGQRAEEDACLAAIQNGDLHLQSVQGLAKSAMGNDKADDALYELRLRISPGAVQSDRAALLHFNNQLVEIAKRPRVDQLASLKEAQARVKDLPRISGLLTPSWPKLYEAFRRDAALLRCGYVMLAVERYRITQRDWPAQLTDLVPTHLSSVPADPYDGTPLRFRRSKDGVVIYSIGADEQDNGGNIDNTSNSPGTDRGFRLWDVPKRRQPPKPLLKE